jgi:hypothetical protein
MSTSDQNQLFNELLFFYEIVIPECGHFPYFCKLSDSGLTNGNIANVGPNVVYSHYKNNKKKHHIDHLGKKTSNKSISTVYFSYDIYLRIRIRTFISSKKNSHKFSTSLCRFELHRKNIRKVWAVNAGVGIIEKIRQIDFANLHVISLSASGREGSA